MTLEELKDSNLSAEERAKSVVNALGLEGNERSVVVGLKKGDKFQIVAMNKMELTNNTQREGQARFVPITFTTNSGASIGAKHFAGVTIDDKAPAIGSTPLENANFLVWCIDHKVTFVVKASPLKTSRHTEKFRLTPRELTNLRLRITSKRLGRNPLSFIYK